MTTNENANGNNSVVDQEVKNPALEKAIDEFIAGLKIENVKLTANRGSQRLAMIFDKEGNALKEVDPDEEDAAPRVIKLLGDSTWQLVDAVAAKLKATPNAARAMIWRWDAKQQKYVVDRSEFTDTNRKVGPEGALNQLFRRHLLKGQVSNLPGAAELGLLSKAATEIAKSIKDQKGKIPSDAAQRMTMHLIAFYKGIGLNESQVRGLLHQAWPELWNTPKKETEPAKEPAKK